MGARVIDHGFLGLFIEVVGDHRAIALFQGLYAAFDGFPEKPKPPILPSFFSWARVW